MKAGSISILPGRSLVSAGSSVKVIGGSSSLSGGDIHIQGGDGERRGYGGSINLRPGSGSRSGFDHSGIIVSKSVSSSITLADSLVAIESSGSISLGLSAGTDSLSDKRSIGFGLINPSMSPISFLIRRSEEY